MDVSVVICGYASDLATDLHEAIRSVLDQSYEHVDVVVVIDGNDQLCESVRNEYADEERVTIRCNDRNRGLSASRNVGIRAAGGDVVAFMDDDAIADEDWIQRLVDTYRQYDALAVGGKMTPIWSDGPPRFLPEEFYWLVGVTHRGFADEEGVQEVHNTFGSNISFRSEVLDEMDGFDTELGRAGEQNLQGEETELCARLRMHYESAVLYVPDATVGHKVFPYRTTPKWLLDRAFWQGYSKRHLAIVSPATGGSETEFLRSLVLDDVPRRLSNIVRHPSLDGLIKLVMLFVLTVAVGAGYTYGLLSLRSGDGQ